MCVVGGGCAGVRGGMGWGWDGRIGWVRRRRWDDGGMDGKEVGGDGGTG